jgi:hypothetical protein
MQFSFLMLPEFMHRARLVVSHFNEGWLVVSRGLKTMKVYWKKMQHKATQCSHLGPLAPLVRVCFGDK